MQFIWAASHDHFVAFKVVVKFSGIEFSIVIPVQVTWQGRERQSQFSGAEEWFAPMDNELIIVDYLHLFQSGIKSAQRRTIDIGVLYDIHKKFKITGSYFYVMKKFTTIRIGKIVPKDTTLKLYVVGFMIVRLLPLFGQFRSEYGRIFAVAVGQCSAAQ